MRALYVSLSLSAIITVTVVIIIIAITIIITINMLLTIQGIQDLIVSQLVFILALSTCTLASC